MQGAPLNVWVVYDHPRDYPEGYVARRWQGTEATDDAVASRSLMVLRRFLIEHGLTRMARQDDDDPVILEVWL